MVRSVLQKEKFVFLHFKPYNKGITIIYDALQHYYDSRCSPESWSSLLRQPLAKNSGGACALRQSVRKYNKCSF